MTPAVRQSTAHGLVQAVRVHHRRTALRRPFVTAVRRADHLDVVLVEVVDDAGRRGWGEAAASWRVTGESPAGIEAVVTGPLAEVVTGRDPADPDTDHALSAAVWGNAAARSAVACALADLAATQSDLALADVLGAHGRRVVRTDMTLSAAAPRELAVLAEEHLGAGFRCLKVKVGAGHDTVAGIRAVREAVGSACSLRLDANQAWTPAEAVRTIRACEDAGLHLELVEQPVAAADLAGLAEVTAAVDTPIMADEAVRTSVDVQVVADRGAADLVNVKLAKTGGLREAGRCAAAARSAGLGLVFGCMLESSVGVTAAASLAAALAPDQVHDLDAGHWLAQPALPGGARHEGPHLVLADDAGLGFHPWPTA